MTGSRDRESIDVPSARRLALARAGLLKRSWTGMPRRATGRGLRARRAAQAVVERFGYLQLDTVSVAGARSHGLVLLSRLDGFDPRLAEDLLGPDRPLFEYWGHEASWIPIDLYPAFAFRRRAYCEHPWWGDVLAEHPAVAAEVLRHVEADGPLRSTDLSGDSPGGGWWNHKLTKRVAAALWSSGALAIRERRSFQRVFDLPERVIDDAWRRDLALDDALDTLLLRALDGHGWATVGTLAATWRLRNLRAPIQAALERLRERGEIAPCTLATDDRPLDGWIRPADLELAERLRRVRPRRDRGVLLSPFDPVLWDRGRVERLFGFEQILEIYKPESQRRWGYFCLPVLAGERLVARVDLKAHRRDGTIEVRALHYEATAPSSADREAVRTALERHALSVGLEPRPRPHEAAAI